DETLQKKPIAEKITPLVQRQKQPGEEEEPVQAKPVEEVQRQEKSEEEEEEPVQTKPDFENSTPTTSDPDTKIHSLRGEGSPLPTAARAFFEPRFGSGFAGVRVHTGPQASDAAESVRAQAFTAGRDIVFGRDQYSPDSPAGQRLLAHELTHVIQQTNPPGGSAGSIPPPIHRQANAPQTPATTPATEASANPPAPQYGKSCSGNSGGSMDPCQKLRCTASQLDTIRGDVVRAIGYVNTAMISLLQPIKDNARQAMDWYMGGHDDRTVETAIKRLGEILGALTDTRDIDRIGCDPADSNTAYTCAGGHAIDTDSFSPVCLTNHHFDHDERHRAQTMIHECAHRMGMSVGEPTNFDDIYQWSAHFLFLSTDEALQNSDSFALLAGAIAKGIPVSYVPHVSFGAGAAVSPTGATTWQGSLHLDMEFQHPLLGFFNPTLGIGIAMIGETTPSSQPYLSSPLSALYSLLVGFRIENPRPGASGGLYLSLFGGPSLDIQSGGATFLGAEAGMALGYRWRFLDISTGVSYAYDPSRLSGMQNLLLSGVYLSFIPGIF
ncbi:MAG: DUF4157 domain-containing protein, partial [Anaerolineales bacterium]